MTARQHIERGLLRIEGILRWGDPSPTELGLAFLTVAWGALLLLPGESLMHPWWSGARDLAPEPTWGLFFASLGTLHVLAVSRGRNGIRRAVAFCQFFVWIFLACLIVAVNPTSTGVPMYSASAIAAAWVYIRRGGDELDHD